MNAETGHATWDSRGHKQPYLTVKALEHLQGSYSFFNGVGQRGWSQNTSKTLLLVNDLIRLKTPGLWAVVLPLLYIVAILLYLPTLHSMRKLSRTKLPIASFVVYILVLEFIGLILQLADCILVLFKGIRVLTITQFVGRSACQSLAMAYSCFRHVLSLLYLALALDTLRYAKSPRCRYTSFNRHCAYNILILAIALMATMDSQFFWTFDLSSVQNHIASGDNADVFYQCDFLASWPLNPAFVSYFWPLADHLIGEILPCVVPILAGIICLSRLCLSRPKRTPFLPLSLERNGTPGGSPFLKRRFTEQAIWIIPIFYMLNGSSILPRLLYFGIKYFLFAGTSCPH
ncbi:unnamed protein product [Dibothriocephalus latus]|uniref:G-protein coupled receptors family 1 profile domain-containing protein n=1 Tax=Dibothriocephalus latus TaxID=60516 RepID=A0A3P7NRD1_DIBLA|nr:unnamed protein product [Dibothriocephalus latus]